MSATPLADLYDDHGIGPLFPHWEEAVPALVLVAIVLYVVGWVLVPRIARQLEERGAAIEGRIEEADTIQAEAAKVLGDYRAALTEARHDAAKSREEARAQGALIIADARERATGEAARMVEEAQRQIQAGRERALDALRPDIERAARQLAGRMLGENP